MPLIPRIISCFRIAAQVSHYYNIHTDADDIDGRVSVENLRLIVERMTQLPIVKKEVPHQAVNVRGLMERYKDHVAIYIPDSLSEEQKRGALVKELCHPLIDEQQDFSVDGVETIRGLLKYTAVPFDGKESDQVKSEHLAEFVAIELLYPLEYRDGDRERIAKGATILDIAKKRGVPPNWVARAIDPRYVDICRAIWKELEPAHQFPPLQPLATDTNASRVFGLATG